MLPILYFQVYVYRVITLVAGLLLTLHAFNGCESCRIGYHHFSTLPQSVQYDVSTMARKWFEGFKEIYKEDLKGVTRLGFHINANDCKGHGGIQHQEPWEYHINLCASPELLEWCRDEPTWVLFKTTEHDLLVDKHFTLKMSMSCYRVHFFSRFLAEVGLMIPIKICFLCLVFSLMALKKYEFGINAQQRINEIHEKEAEREAEREARRAARSPKGPTRSPGHPDIKKNLVSRHDNYKKKR